MPIDWIGDATFSGGGKYRYTLIRAFYQWTIDAHCVFIMLNPSTAVASFSDPTVRRCEGYTRLWGYKALVVVNLFGLRSTDPKQLYKDADPVGPENDRFIMHHVRKAGVVICAWGVHGKFMGRGGKVLDMVKEYRPQYLKLSKLGVPMHPLYLKANLKPQPVFA